MALQAILTDAMMLVTFLPPFTTGAAHPERNAGGSAAVESSSTRRLAVRPV
jgi:hypothetical protein